MKVKEYAEGWDSRRMLVGSVRAGDIVEACRDAVLRLEALSAANTVQQANTAIALLKQWAEYCEAGGVNADHQLCQATIEFAGQRQ